MNYNPIHIPGQEERIRERRQVLGRLAEAHPTDPGPGVAEVEDLHRRANRLPDAVIGTVCVCCGAYGNFSARWVQAGVCSACATSWDDHGILTPESGLAAIDPIDMTMLDLENRAEMDRRDVIQTNLGDALIRSLARESEHAQRSAKRWLDLEKCEGARDTLAKEFLAEQQTTRRLTWLSAILFCGLCWLEGWRMMAWAWPHFRHLAAWIWRLLWL